MGTQALITLDLLIALLAAAGWLAAGAVAAAGRARAALGLGAGAVAVTLARVWSVVALAGQGWWFAQEKVALTLPLAGLTAAGAVVLAGPGLVRAARHGSPIRSAASGRSGAESAVKRPEGHGEWWTAAALLTSGYAAAAGLVVTLLVGYPVGWSAAVVSVAAVAVATLVTVRVTAPRSGPRLGVALAVALALILVGWGLAARPVASAATTGVPVSSLVGPATPDPGGAVRRFTLTARTGTVTLPSGQRVAAWTFNGQVPGPPITVNRGDLVEVRLRNADIRSGVTLHWHGYDVPAAEDGVPGLTQDPVLPGGEYVYRFRAEQTGTYWYHTHEVSDLGVRMGLYGMFVVAPAPGLDLSVPVHTLGGRITLGGDRVVAPGTPVRLRLVDTDNVAHRFTLDGVGYRLAAVDGTDLNAPAELHRTGLRLAAGGRYDLTFTMPANGVALLVDNDRSGGLRLLPGPGASVAVADPGGWPDLDLTRYGSPAPTPFGAASRFDRDFTLVLDQGLSVRGWVPRFGYTVNGRSYPAIPELVVREGDLVRMTVVNRGRSTHPWHLHGHRVLVLARDGHPVTGSPLWMDTFDVRPGEVWVVAFRADNPGIWMNHCHNLSHAAQGMALHLAYEGVESSPHGGHHSP